MKCLLESNNLPCKVLLVLGTGLYGSTNSASVSTDGFGGMPPISIIAMGEIALISL